MDKAHVILVTGGNRGIGREVCRQLRAQGREVLLTARNEAQGRKVAEELDVAFMPLDISDRASITRLAERLEAEGIRLDALVNNAAILPAEGADLLEVDADLLDSTLQTNSLGPFFLTRALLDRMNRGSQLVMVSSGAGTFCEGVGSYAPLYSLSKTLLNVFTRHLARELHGRKIAVNAVCPGWVRTDMGGSSAPRSVQQGAETIVWLAAGGAGKASGFFFRDKKKIAW
jgi:NAD(P)-dependent dehydrogenase (short-subunit alcohol dehydrogenase family)